MSGEFCYDIHDMILSQEHAHVVIEVKYRYYYS